MFIYFYLCKKGQSGEPEVHFFDKKARRDSKIALSDDDRLIAIYDSEQRGILVYEKNRVEQGAVRREYEGAYKAAVYFLIFFNLFCVSLF